MNSSGFDESSAAAVLDEVRVSPAAPLSPYLFAISLNNILASYEIDLWFEAKPGHADLAQRANLIDQSCRTILRAAGFGVGCEVGPGGLAAGMGPGGLYRQAASSGAGSGEIATLNALRAVSALQGWAQSMVERESALASRAARGGRPSAAARKRLAARLAETYFAIWDRVPGAGAKGGPFPRFMDAFARVAVESGVDSELTGSKLLTHWRSLPWDERLSMPRKDELPQVGGE